MEKITEAISRFAVGLSGFGIILMLVLVVADVLLRTFFNVSIPGNDTIVASYLMVAAIFLPLALLQVLDENIVVDALYDRLPTIVQDLLDVLAHLLAVLFYLLLGWIYYRVAIEAFEVKEYITGTWNVPIWPARILMPAGLFLGSLAALVKTALAIRNLIAGTPPPPHQSSGAF
ncbi:TRAP transporter small permease [Salipiger sp. P9]|uniref:TRAP transporter small permease n=1 Tax=Salipiger pentaromativorans TaxID=2943193 RepID=UPI0021580356|nr:TRAP transporter small permease [Salipiger pentaromativorans]MCR8549202.1 TRAP transporter small permease [Salipiger pentaromativorans]